MKYAFSNEKWDLKSCKVQKKLSVPSFVLFFSHTQSRYFTEVKGIGEDTRQELHFSLDR